MLIKDLQVKNQRKLLAFELKFKGNTYEQIEAATGYSVKYLENKFYKNGLWYEEYQSWRAYQLELIQERFTDMFIAQATQANQQVVNIASGVLSRPIKDAEGNVTMIPVPLTGKTILSAAKDILDRAGFRPAEKVEVKNPEDTAASIWDRYNSAKKKDKVNE